MKALIALLFLALAACGDTSITQTGGGSDTVVDQDETSEALPAVE